MKPEWARSVRDQCERVGVAFFFKQWGTYGGNGIRRVKRANGRTLRTRCALLTQREREVLTLLIDGLPTKLIAHRLGISARTTEHHRAAVMQKMQARTISHLVQMAVSLGHFNGANNSAK
jgi:DNA-binding CsgD family transcriptional regulator